MHQILNCRSNRVPMYKLEINESRRIEPFADFFRVRDFADQVRTVPGVAENAGCVVRAADSKIERGPRLERDNSRNLPSAEGSSRELVAVSENREVVNEVDESVVSAVKLRWPDIVPPSNIRIGYVVEVAAAAVAGGCVNCLRERIAKLQLKIPGDATVEIDLQ